jgi:hypothetical protein
MKRPLAFAFCLLPILFVCTRVFPLLHAQPWSYWEVFEAKKLSLMAEFAGRSCLRTDHLRYMMSKLSQEDNKLALLIAAKGHIYDPQRLLEVSADFFLARNKAKVAEIVDGDREP